MLALLDAALSHGARESQRASQPTKKTSINVERPVLDATSTLADFTTWKESWEDCVRCQHLRSQDRETRVAALRQSLDEELRRYIRQDIICISEEDDDDAIIGAIEAFVRRRRNSLLDRLEFYNLKQDDNELFDSFLTVLKELYKACDFTVGEFCTTCTRSLRRCGQCWSSVQRRGRETLRDRLVIGIRDDDTRHKRLSTPALTLEDAVRTCRAEQAAKATQQDMPEAQVGRAQALRKTRYQLSKQSQTSSIASSSRSHESQSSGKPPVRSQEGDDRPTDRPTAKCPKCGYDSHPLSRCPAREKTCNSCGEKGHFQRRCPADAPPLDHLRLQSQT
eukprot:scpid66887/ scgid14437/ 